jgi:hypothetical protein
MVGFEMFGNRARVRQFIIRCIFKTDGKAFHRLIHSATHHGNDGTGIQAAAEKSAQGHITHQTNFYGVVEDFQKLVAQFVFALLRRPVIELPVFLNFDIAVFINKPVSGRQFVNAFENR